MTDVQLVSDVETWLAEQLKARGIDIYHGEFPTFRERLRAAIIGGRVAHTIIGRHRNGSSETYLQFFERVFQEPLIKPTQHDSTRRGHPHGESKA